MDQNSNNPQKKKRTSIFFRHLEKDGKGVDKSDVIKIDEYNTKNFFKLYFRRIRDIIKINWIYIFGNFPVLILLLAISGNFSNAATAPQSQFYPILYGMGKIAGTSETLSAAAKTAISPLIGIHGIMGTVTSYSTTDYVLFAISALFLVTFGLINTGCAYLMRNIVKGEPLFYVEDLKTSIKQNMRQGIILGVLDLLVFGLCTYSIAFYLSSYQTYYILFFCSLAMMAFYMFMRYYMYMLLVTFELSIVKIIKNSFIFAVMSLGKNFCALILIIGVAAITLMSSMIFMPLGIIILFMFFFSTVVYISTYFAYPKMKKVMIDPYYPTYGKDSCDEE